MHLDEVADGAGVDQVLGGVVRAVPGERPVDREAVAGRGHGGDHPAGVGGAGGEGLLDHDVEAVRGDGLDGVGVGGGGGADDGEVGGGLREAGGEVGEDALGRDREGLDGGGHAGGVGVVDAGDLGVGMVGDLAEEVAHVHVVEADAEDAVSGQGPLPRADLPGG